MTYLEDDLICMKVKAKVVDIRFIFIIVIIEKNNINMKIAVVK